MTDTDIIAAIATPVGVGGVGVIRISGPDLSPVLHRLFDRSFEPRKAALVSLKDSDDRVIDKGLLLYFPGPASFTGEDVVEFHGHGGPVVMNLALRAFLDAGARRAGPGEFSRRAFDNDKLDLVQAEAIADLIASGTEEAARAAVRSLSGDFSARVHALVEALTQLRIHVEAAIDFPDEDIDFLSDDALLERIKGCRDEFESLIANSRTGRLLRDGYRVVIAGLPNAGKSSLMNALSGDDTAIVTSIAGTTRDILRETINLDGLLVELVDTAGLRDNADVVEEEGIRRAQKAMDSADAILWLSDSTGTASEPPSASVPVLKVFNKTDLTGRPAGLYDQGHVYLSASTGDGLDTLKTEIRRLAGAGDLSEGTFTARERHIDALNAAFSHFRRGVDQLTEFHAGDLLAEELRLAQAELAGITGEFTADDLLGRIFADFCIGK